MALIGDVRKVCARLAPKGWSALLRRHGLNLGAAELGDNATLARELARSLPAIDRASPGFADFAPEGVRGIEPGMPARSLLYHALASPSVTAESLTAYPTLAEIETIENYVFGVEPPSIQELRVQAGNGLLAVVVFAVEYRPAHETVHGYHADLCFSRTGIARVGTKPAAYLPSSRGFLPNVAGDGPHDIRVLPARYAAYIAVQRKGGDPSFGPMNPQDGDNARDFWVPVHKLFAGGECVRGLALTLALRAEHVNEKLRRIHLATEGRWGWAEPDISKPPFRFSDNLASFAVDGGAGHGVLVPIPQPLVAPARYAGKRLTFRVPRSVNVFASSILIDSDGPDRRAPEFVHARHAVSAGGKLGNLNDRPDVATVVRQGDYAAQHYVDFTADGWIEAECEEISTELPRRVPAYSLITPPDFFVNTDQREIVEWVRQSVRSGLRRSLWVTAPDTLNDTRLAPNLGLTPRFVREDVTVTAIVALSRKRTKPETPPKSAGSQRHTHLPDAAAGIFAPGWDVSRDTTHGTGHLASYGLGSPFPEDAKLCAALSTFWPAVAPDSARVFEPNVIGDSPTVAPLTDREIGIRGLAWDGVEPPRVRRLNGVEVVEYAEFDHVDYVETALDGKFSLVATGAIQTPEYGRRVHAMARVYRALGITSSDENELIRQRARWSLLSFQEIDERSMELREAESDTGHTSTLPILRFELYLHGKDTERSPDARKTRVPILERTIAFVDGLQVLVKRGDREWRRVADA